MEKTNKEFNEKCAEYLGWRNVTFTNKGVIEPTTIWTDKNGSSGTLHFDSDWNWIMILLEAILDECSEQDKLRNYYVIVDKIPNLEKTKQAIINYINENNNS
jgi:hypothetical protein